MSLLDDPSLARYVARQLSSFFPDRTVEPSEIEEAVVVASQRFSRCFSRLRVKYATPRVNHLVTDQYAVFLYYLSNTLFRGGSTELAGKTYALNKALHAADLFYEVELPEVFALQHPVGTVIGRGTFSNYLFVYQRCSIGSSLEGDYPVFAEGVVMFGGSAVIGKCNIGPNTWLSVGTVVMDQDTPGNCVVFGRSPNLVIKPTRRDVIAEMFKAR